MTRRDPPGDFYTRRFGRERRILIVVGAERTETAYLRGLRDHFDAAALKIVEKPAAPDQLVEYTRDNVHSGNPSTGMWRLVNAVLERE